ncbi:Fez family zinc finger protein 2 [Folsomia candida]|uniref:Fez family zinc finger protein 2 n=1 Tax=Folsomia candida TaxID=158441 RepID=A0A226DN27_FOLCA|nr:Fez family zinc finger protein 2 [Folsomia candida]
MKPPSARSVASAQFSARKASNSVNSRFLRSTRTASMSRAVTARRTRSPARCPAAGNRSDTGPRSIRINGHILRHKMNHIKSVHLSREEGAARFTCDICGKGLIDKSKLARHRKIHIDPADAPHLCTLCGKRFRLNEYLNIHMRSHDPDRQEKYPQYMRKKKSKDAGVRMGVAGAKIGRPVVVKKVGTTTGDQNLGKLD